MNDDTQQLKGQPATLFLTVDVTRKATGKTEQHKLIGHPDAEMLAYMVKDHSATGALAAAVQSIPVFVFPLLAFMYGLLVSGPGTDGVMEILVAMTLTHSTAAKNAATDAVTALIGASGNLKFRLAGTLGAPGTAVATCPLSATAFGASSAGVATANAIASDTNAAGNASPVANATLETSGGTVVIHCAVAASASDINMSNGLTVASGDTVSVSSLTYQALPA